MDLPAYFKERYGIGGQDIRTCPALTLAYIGDAVYELIIRTYFVQEAYDHADKLNKKVSDTVKAQAQAETMHRIMDSLDEEELSYYKRGRNAKPHSVPKHAKISDYMTATGFEDLIGYLYLTGKNERIMELIHEGHKEFFENK